MQKAFDLIVERLEELKKHYHQCCWVNYNEGAEVALTESISIVNQVAEEYKSTEHINCSTDDLISRSALLGAMDKRYKEKEGNVLDNLAEGFMQMEKLIKEQPTVSVNDGWIPCSDRLPEETDEDLAGDYLDHLDELIEQGVFKLYLVTIEGAKVPTELYYVGYAGEALWYDEITEEFYKVIAWQELPSVYQP